MVPRYMGDACGQQMAESKGSLVYATPLCYPVPNPTLLHPSCASPTMPPCTLKSLNPTQSVTFGQASTDSRRNGYHGGAEHSVRRNTLQIMATRCAQPIGGERWVAPSEAGPPGRSHNAGGYPHEDPGPPSHRPGAYRAKLAKRFDSPCTHPVKCPTSTHDLHTIVGPEKIFKGPIRPGGPICTILYHNYRVGGRPHAGAQKRSLRR